MTREGKDAGVGVKKTCTNDHPARIYPNPIRNGETLTIESADASTIELMNMQGVVMMQKKSAGEVNTLTLENLSQGMYLLVITNHNGDKQVLKIVIR